MSTVVQINALLSGIIDPNTSLPAAGGSVEFYVPGTSTGKNVWTEAAKSNAYTSYTLDDAGAAELWADGSYDVVIKDASGTTLYEWSGVYFTKHGTQSVTMATDYAQTVDDDIILFSSAAVAGRTLTLLDPADWPEKILYLQNLNDTYDLTITPDAGNIDGGASITLASGAQGIQIYTDGSNCFSSGGSQNALVATDGSGRQAVVDEDGLHDDNDTQDFYYLLGAPTESHILSTLTLKLTYASATTITAILNDITTTYVYNAAARVATAGITNGGSDSGVSITGNAITLADDILSPYASSDCQIIGIVSWQLMGTYDINTSDTPHFTCFAYGTYPNSSIIIYIYDDTGTSLTLHTLLASSGDTMTLHIAYLTYLVT
jgi:hypothetical protein